MATNIDVTLKRYNGTDYDQILPTTHLGQIYTDNTLVTSLADFLTNTYINVDQIGAANGLATLDSNQKLTLSQLPNGIVGGLKFRGTLTDGSVELYDLLIQNFGSKEEAVGSYYIAGADLEIANSNGGNNITIDGVGDEGDNQFPVNLEAGDWVVISAADFVPQSPSFQVSIINNTYQNATIDAKGIVTLSNITNLGSASGNNVITDGILAGLIGTATGDIAAGDHLHDNRYYTETEIGNFFEGTTSITGYNKTNWDTAYGDKVDAVAFNTGDGVLTLTRQDAGTLTVDLDGRYLEGLTAAQTDSTTGIVVANTGQDFTVAHADTSSQASVDNSNGSVIQDITLDTFGHITAIGSLDLDTRYYTETEIDNWIDGSGTINGNTYVPILYGAAPTSTITGALIIDLD